MSAPTPATWVTAAFTASTAGTDDVPIFGVGDTVFRFGDMPAAGANVPIPFTKFTVVFPHVLPFSDGSDGLNDQRNDDINSADAGVSSPAVAGFGHTGGAISGAESATTESRPWFYGLKDGSGKIVPGQHESQLTNLAGWKAFADVRNDDIWT